ncbi:MAG: phenylalanine--tRNA ligase subunit beta [Patescibacteria group bacterium]|nr:phenylalanine--tRNA ligase subunit beta [Patescibacteria group bacterium]MDE1943979.1 phenylalanine--tRNA ligase subunit beta [Patescibacteria group bacterium]MDE1944692.1 phenylalanine--tRNA ligase subunit beta [Patescibacteria group bacterium]MDE2057317.1 phenylalanine--tRNA ligase subunit beta [Patescibacteria group bacterium]
MKASRKWLQKYFDDALPEGQALADAFTFHSFEVEEMVGDLIDLKVLPDRAGYALSHRGVASELAAALDRPLRHDPLREPLPSRDVVRPDMLAVEIEEPEKCARYMAALVKGVKVGPSPDWLRAALESVGQRSINNVVDATNYVMLDIGQPLHAFDAKKLVEKDGKYAIGVRAAKAGEQITTLTGDEYALTPERTVIADMHAGRALAIAGVKGGKAAEVDAETTDIIVESANFDGTSVRWTAQALRLHTEASARFQNHPSPELAAYGMHDVLKLIAEVAGGEVAGVVDAYPGKPAPRQVSTTLARVSGLLGSRFAAAQVEDVWRRLALPYERAGEGGWTITPPFERTDLVIPEDLAEEVGRVLGYDTIDPVELPPPAGEPDQNRFRGIERMKDQLVEQGFTEVSTQSFVKKGDIRLANPLDKTRPVLRISLEETLGEALKKAKQYAPLFLPPGEKPRLFEVGSVFPMLGEYLELRMTEAAREGVPTHDNLTVAKLEDYGAGYDPKRYELSEYHPFSQYPFVLRDIAAWSPAGQDADSTIALIQKEAGELLRRIDLFDSFTKGERTSYAFRLVFESMDRTLTDEEVNGVMERVAIALGAKGYEIR